MHGPRGVAALQRPDLDDPVPHPAAGRAMAFALKSHVPVVLQVIVTLIDNWKLIDGVSPPSPALAHPSKQQAARCGETRASGTHPHTTEDPSISELHLGRARVFLGLPFRISSAATCMGAAVYELVRGGVEPTTIRASCTACLIHVQ